MVKGINIFKEHFKDYKDNYRIIGGTACDVIITGQGFIPRATRDIDLIIVLDTYNPDFNKKLWEFIIAAGYKSLQKDMKEQHFYRFTDPINNDYPFQLELICKDPIIIRIPDGRNISPIDPDEDFSHLSVMVMDDEYYDFTLTNSNIVDDLYLASSESLICLKALAYQNLLKLKKEGKHVNDNDLSKHKNDVIRLSMLLDETVINLPETIKHDLEHFLLLIEEEKPDISNLLKHMQIDVTSLGGLITSIRHKFGLTSSA